MKKSFLFAGSLFFLLSLFACQTVSSQVEDRTAQTQKLDQEQLRKLLKNLDQIITSSSHDDIVSQTYQVLRRQMEAGQLFFMVDKDSLSKDILQGIYYSPNATGPSWIVCTPYIIKLSQTRPELVLSLLVNAMVFAESHAEKGASFILDYKNPINAFLYSMDALYVQSIFIDKYLAQSAANLGMYERFLADGLSFDGLSSVAIYVVGVDQMIVYGMLELGKNLGSASIEDSAYFDEVDVLFDDVLSRMREVLGMRNALTKSSSPEEIENEKRSSYIAGVSALSILHYAIPIIDGHLTAHPALQNKVFQARRLSINEKAQLIKNNLGQFTDKVSQYRTQYLRSLGL